MVWGSGFGGFGRPGFGLRQPNKDSRGCLFQFRVAESLAKDNTLKCLLLPTVEGGIDVAATLVWPPRGSLRGLEKRFRI